MGIIKNKKGSENRLEIKTLIIYTMLYFSTSSIYSYYLKDKVKTVKHLFFINMIKIMLAIVLVYFYLEKITPFEKVISSLLDNTALIIAVIGFTLQNSIKNIIAGALLSYSGAFSLGDRITLRIRDLTGYVENITLRHTVIRTYTNERVIVPNALLNEEIIINNHLTEKQQSYPITFTFSKSENIAFCSKLMEDAVREHKEIINDEIEVLCSDISNDGVTLKTFIWTNKIEDNFKVASEIRLNILNKMKMNNISIK